MVVSSGKGSLVCAAAIGELLSRRIGLHELVNGPIELAVLLGVGTP